MRCYLPTTLAGLAAAYASGTVGPSDDAVVAQSEGEEDEYAALMTAADVSAVLLPGLGEGHRRRVVVVVEATTPDEAAPWRDVVALHVDPVDDADPDEDLAWYATQEIDSLLAGIV